LARCKHFSIVTYHTVSSLYHQAWSKHTDWHSFN